MYLIITRAFPPELGGMQSLMWGLTKEMSKNFMIKVFADHIDNHKDFDEQASFSIERVGGIKLLRKYRKAQLINEYIKQNKIDAIIADHWKSLELIKSNKKKYFERMIQHELFHMIQNSNINKFDEKASFSIERVGGIKLLRKYRKAQLINEYIKENKKSKK